MSLNSSLHHSIVSVHDARLDVWFVHYGISRIVHVLDSNGLCFHVWFVDTLQDADDDLTRKVKVLKSIADQLIAYPNGFPIG